MKGENLERLEKSSPKDATYEIIALPAACKLTWTLVMNAMKSQPRLRPVLPRVFGASLSAPANYSLRESSSV